MSNAENQAARRRRLLLKGLCIQCGKRPATLVTSKFHPMSALHPTTCVICREVRRRRWYGRERLTHEALP